MNRARRGGAVIVGRSKRTEPPYRIYRGKPVGYTVSARFDVAEHGLERAWQLARDTRDRLVRAEFGKSIDELVPARAPFILRQRGDRVVAEVTVHDTPPFWRRPRKVISRTFSASPEGAERNARLWAEILVAYPANERRGVAKLLAPLAVSLSQMKAVSASLTADRDIIP